MSAVGKAGKRRREEKKLGAKGAFVALLDPSIDPKNMGTVLTTALTKRSVDQTIECYPTAVNTGGTVDVRFCTSTVSLADVGAFSDR
jgi:hypothetical protein